MFPVEYNEGKIYIQSDGNCVISFRNQWIAGVYENEETAKHAIDLVLAGKEQWLSNLRGITTMTEMRLLERMELVL